MGAAVQLSAPRRSRRPGARSTTSDEFLTAAFTAVQGSGLPLSSWVLLHPVLAARCVHAIGRLPACDVLLPNDPEGRIVMRALLAFPTSRRAMRGVAAALAAPVHYGTFAEGRERATLRRKIRAAQRREITVRAVPEARRAAMLALADRHERENEREQYRIASPDNDDLLKIGLWLAAYDADGHPLVLAVIPCAGEWAALRYFRTLIDGPASSDARYLLTEAVAEALGHRGVRYLVDTARPHWLPNGLRHFQRMVGFRLIRLRSIRLRD